MGLENRSNGEVVDLQSVQYHIFVALGDYDYELTLANMTIEEPIETFDSDQTNSTTQHDAIDGEEFNFIANTTFLVRCIRYWSRLN